MTLPFFVASGPPVPLDADPAQAAHLCDVFRSVAPRPAGAEWLVVADLGGRLALVPATARAALPPRVQAALAGHALLAPARRLDAEELWLFDLHRVQDLPDHPGTNDPVQAEGVLFGPFPEGGAAGTPGRLTVSRADLLDGLLRGAASVLHAGAPGEEAASAFHGALLPGDAELTLRAGRGLVLAYPRPEGREAGNVAATVRILHQLLAGLRVDLERAGADAPLVKKELPVPSRDALVAALEARGFRVRGRSATRPKSGWVGKFFREHVRVPEQADAASLLAIADAALEWLPGWPDARSRALRERVRLAEVSWSAGFGIGLRPVEAEGDHLDVRKGAVETWFASKKKPRHVHLRADEHLAPRDGQLELLVELEDGFSGEITCAYGAPGRPDAPSSDRVRLGGTDRWRGVTFALPGAALRGTLPGGADLRLSVRDGSLRARRIVLRARAVPPVAHPRVVYHDARYEASWVMTPAKVAADLARRGFEVLDADRLAAWLEERAGFGAPGTVCVLTHGIVPDTVVRPPDATCVLRRYLDAGGRVVWIGDAPFHYLGTPDGRRAHPWAGSQRAVLGGGDQWAERRARVALTAAGLDWGLTVPDLASRCHRAADVDLVLTRAGRDWAASWIKRFDASRPASGFVRLRGGAFDAADARLLDDLARVALHAL